MKKRGQISVEYIIVISFVTFLIISYLVVAFFYNNQIQDRIRFNQIENLANKIITSSEDVYYAGKPSQVLIKGYLPTGVISISLIGKEILFNLTSSSGPSQIIYPSNVVLQGSISNIEGMKVINIVANENNVSVNSN